MDEFDAGGFGISDTDTVFGIQTRGHDDDAMVAGGEEMVVIRL